MVPNTGLHYSKANLGSEVSVALSNMVSNPLLEHFSHPPHCLCECPSSGVSMPLLSCSLPRGDGAAGREDQAHQRDERVHNASCSHTKPCFPHLHGRGRVSWSQQATSMFNISPASTLPQINSFNLYSESLSGNKKSVVLL